MVFFVSLCIFFVFFVSLVTHGGRLLLPNSLFPFFFSDAQNLIRFGLNCWASSCNISQKKNFEPSRGTLGGLFFGFFFFDILFFFPEFSFFI